MDWRPPPTRVGEVEEIMHGVRIVDPYRWLEDSDSAETRGWTAAQNAHTRSALDGLPFRPRIRERLAELWSIGLLGVPVKRGNRAFYLRRDAAQDQAVLYLREVWQGEEEEPLVDPNELGAEHLITVDWFYPSWDGDLVAYGLSHGGDEMSTLHVIEVGSKRVLQDRIPDTRFATVAWLPDSSGFFYTRYPAKGSVPPGEERYNQRVRFHQLGTDPRDDPVVFGDGRAPTDIPVVSISRRGRWLVVHVHQGWAKQSLHILDRADPAGGFTAIGDDLDAIFEGHAEGERLFLRTNWDAPNWRLLELDARSPDLASSRTLIAERRDVILNAVRYVAGRIAADELEDASSRLRVYSREGVLEREIALPGIGSVVGLGGEWDEPELLYAYTSFLTPTTVLWAELETGEGDVFARLPSPPRFDPTDYEVTRVRCPSKDGTLVPLFLVHRRGVRADGSNPTVLYGYGGFNVNMTPSYIATLPLWVESGGIYAIAVLRGGGEFGESWHGAGMLARKQNVFDDYLAATDWLTRERFTSRDRLALYGGSNGGLLVGAALTQRPDVARAVVCAVPLLDMLRYHHFQIAKLWIAEYGSADDPEQFRWLLAYSPYQNVRDGEAYPAVLLTTALGDSRVDPMHARKTAARLQVASSSELPVLLRVETEAGHGIGKPRWKQIEESADVWSFIFWQLGVET